jgi:hypothetical protein
MRSHTKQENGTQTAQHLSHFEVDQTFCILSNALYIAEHLIMNNQNVYTLTKQEAKRLSVLTDKRDVKALQLCIQNVR